VLGGTEHIDYFTYDYVSNKTQERLAYAVQKGLAYSAKWEYDYAGRVTKAYNADGGSITNTYSALGQLATATDFSGTPTVYSYDSIDRLLEEKGVIEQNGGTVYNSFKRYDYGPAGNVTKTRVSNNQVGSSLAWARTDYDYNNRGRLEFVTQYDGANINNVTKYTYDGVGNTLTMRTGMSSKGASDGQQTTYTYDRLGRILTLKDPLNQQEAYAYKNSGLGLLNTKTDRNGNVSTYNYDALGRVLTEQVKTPGNVTETNSYSYYVTGAKKTEANPTVTTAFVYDVLGRLAQESESGGAGAVKAYGYDLANNRTSFTATKSGATNHNTAYTYDNQNRLKTVSDKGSLKATYSYNANGARESLVYTNGTREDYLYNKANWLTSLVNKSGSTVVSSYAYTYPK
jgi:YD repeat-containing protein